MRAGRWLLILAVTLIGAVKGSPSGRGAAASAPRVPIRIWNKVWGDYPLLDCKPDDFGWDSLTFLAAAGDSLRTGVAWYDTTGRRLIRIESILRDSVVVRFPPGFVRSMSTATTVRAEVSREGRVAVGATPVQLTTNSADGGEYFKIAIVRPWPERRPPRSAPDTTTLRGVVLDDSTLAPVRYGAVFVHGTRLASVTDEAGRFRISGVERGDLRIAVCAPTWEAREMTVRTGGPPVEIRLELRPDVRRLRR